MRLQNITLSPLNSHHFLVQHPISGLSQGTSFAKSQEMLFCQKEGICRKAGGNWGTLGLGYSLQSPGALAEHRGGSQAGQKAPNM